MAGTLRGPSTIQYVVAILLIPVVMFAAFLAGTAIFSNDWLFGSSPGGGLLALVPVVAHAVWSIRLIRHGRDRVFSPMLLVFGLVLTVIAILLGAGKNDRYPFG